MHHRSGRNIEPTPTMMLKSSTRGAEAPRGETI
ncbi:hypothetical protein EPIR_0818 [Erwinia piriflorinigrans CFBP 5888]|uniref:Uncharacterized protein n=1 Tax=Erwinia piriflorinigrans CFBP 5888 TaxID=1161919 RepID=V5Z4H5_9GAMM|nr:hypothetical protein EPIR_0818 [Erwinia piriflorinigrans CFBP 5888]